MMVLYGVEQTNISPGESHRLPLLGPQRWRGHAGLRRNAEVGSHQGGLRQSYRHPPNNCGGESSHLNHLQYFVYHIFAADLHLRDDHQVERHGGLRCRLLKLRRLQLRMLTHRHPETQLLQQQPSYVSRPVKNITMTTSLQPNCGQAGPMRSFCSGELFPHPHTLITFLFDACKFLNV